MKYRTKTILGLLLIIFSFTLVSCKKINPCGSFTFTGVANDGAASNGITMNLRFSFDPALCGSDCNTTTICYIQMVRTFDFSEGTYSYISEEHEARAIEYGWYIDRLTGRNWGYYGRNNNGTFANNLTPGNNLTDAILFDAPSRSDAMRNIWWQAVSASVSIDGGVNSCNNNFLGYYYWSWFVDADGTVTDDYIIKGVAWKSLHLVMDDAVTAWNTQAPDLGHNLFPAFDKLMY
ncbi:MAG: hypothetical protein A2W30_07650 [Ignavibacteria bacterium RBG_16_36_9]|nr:MAG: hypothetical protein A2W30_07650 [Ignavibacteria bacterium RBG_16_36_9]